MAKDMLSIRLTPPMASDLARFSKESGLTPDTFATQCVEAEIAERRMLEARAEEVIADGI